MKPVAELSAAQLRAALDKADAVHSAILDEMIANGRGHERPTETAVKDDDLSRRFNASMARMQELRFEARERERYHGSLRPIKRSANPRPRKYATAAERQAAYRARFAVIETRVKPETAETLERISEETGMVRAELVNQMILFALANRNWYTDPSFTRRLTLQAYDDRRRATKYQPVEDDEGNDDDEE